MRLPKKLRWKILMAFLALKLATSTWTFALADASPTFIEAGSTTGQKRVLVFFTGMQSDSETHSRQLRATWQEFGRVLVVRYNPTYFRSKRIIKDTFTKLRQMGADEVGIIDASLGTRLGFDLVDYNVEHNMPMKITSFVAVDPALGVKSLKRGVGPMLLAAYPADVLDNWLFGWVMGALFEPGQTSDPAVNRDALAEHHNRSKHWSLSAEFSQLRFITWRDGDYITPNVRGIPFQLLRSVNDAEINDSVNDQMFKAFGQSGVPYVVDSPHIAFAEHPTVWRKAFKHVLSAIYG